METSLLENKSSLQKSSLITFVSIHFSVPLVLCESLRSSSSVRKPFLVGLVDRRFQPDLVEIVENEV